MTITYLDPAAEESTPAEPYELFLDMDRRPLTIGLIANAFPDAANFTACLEMALTSALPGVTFLRYQKTSVDPVQPEMLGAITSQCDGVISIWGH
ncbi:MAG: hypothetical protein R3B97_00715 [Dehalococcoidia bacterium]|nr:hypothetical protein [Dehalococcoidia bacterium]MCB9485258.1 hypothetical protein [Thermoflexaceae bacterium]